METGPRKVENGCVLGNNLGSDMSRDLMRLILACGLITFAAAINSSLAASAMPVVNVITTHDLNTNLRTQVRDDSEELKRDLKVLNEILSTKDVEAFMEFKRRVDTKWKSNPEARLLLLSQICKSLNSGQFNDPKHTLYARQCAKDLLKDTGNLSVDIEMDMVKILQEVEEYRLGIVEQSSWEKDRTERVAYLRHLADRLNKNYEPSFDFSDLKNLPNLNVCVPAPNYLCGIRPEDIREAEIREEYIALIEVNRQKTRRFNSQLQIHRIMKSFPAFLNQFIIGMYSQEPADFGEMESVMESFAIDNDRKEKIRQTVKKRLDNQ